MLTLRSRTNYPANKLETSVSFCATLAAGAKGTMVVMAMLLQVLIVWVAVIKCLRIGYGGFSSFVWIFSVHHVTLHWQIEGWSSLSSLMPWLLAEANWQVQDVVDPIDTGKWVAVLGEIAVYKYTKPFAGCNAEDEQLRLPVGSSFNCCHTPLCRWDDCFVSVGEKDWCA